MKFTHPILFLTLSIASALTLFTEAAPSSSSFSSSLHHSLPVPVKGSHVAAAALNPTTETLPKRQRRQLQQEQQQKQHKRQRLSSPVHTAAARAPSTNDHSSQPVRRLDKRHAGASKIDRRVSSTQPKKQPQQLRHHKPARSSHSTSSASKNSKSSKGGKRNKRGDKNSDDENRAFAATLRNRKQNRALFSPPQKRAAVPAAPVHRNPAPAGRRARGGNTRSRSPPPPKKNTPLLLLPDSRSVWQAGTYQTVRWNRRYTKSLPADTTVDIVLIDSKTNRKVSSLKRFIPFRKGGSQVWVPAAIPEGVSFVLVLELYRGRSQQQVLGSTTTTTAATAAAGTVYRNRQQQGSSNSQAGSSSSNGDGSVAVQPTDVLSRIVRRSDISISAGIPYPPPPSNNGNYNGRNPTSPKSSSKGTHHDINHDDFYAGPSQERSMEFSPDELRQEYPSTLRPLVLEHTFGLHQKVYTLTPYTLAWKIPDRVAELLEYTRRAQTLFNTLAKNRALASSGSYPRSTFLAKVLVDLIKDDTTESVAVLAKDVPAETMFQYLSIQDRLPLAFYRIRVQLVVVEVETDLRAIVSGQPSPSPVSPSAKFAMEGWEFPEGAKVIDRYEAITRRFWVSQGAL